MKEWLRRGPRTWTMKNAHENPVLDTFLFVRFGWFLRSLTVPFRRNVLNAW